MADPLTLGVVGTAFIKGAAYGAGTVAGSYVVTHGQEITEKACEMVDNTQKAWNNGWKRDGEAGGISSTGSSSAPEPA